MTDPRRDALERRSRHEPAAVEPDLFARWESAGLFRADPHSGRPSYVIALPPPNVTGELHMGHALNGSIQDTLMRVAKMRGRETLWICGTDHASIAVHAVIEKQLRAEGTTRFELGREAFIQRVWEWRRETGATIIQQFKRLGCALDYEHERFTMDDGYARAVLEMFVRLHRKGYIYRDNRIVNWCPGCQSTVSDLEVRYEHAADALYEVRYAIKGSNDHLTVATVRPETLLADTAVAVHPDDDRYRHLVGGTAIVPIVNREVPIIADEYVKMDFGTGALKITPGHDPNDFEIGRKHGLPELSVIGFDGKMNEQAGEFAGMEAAVARQKVVDRLFADGLLRGEQPYEHEVGHCDRSGDRIEPLISLQWFMRMDELAEAANSEVRSGRVRFIPKSQENTYFHWMDNIRPWCVSRQLWWGHQIPVWYCPNGHATVDTSVPAVCAECGSTELERDPDVLDTWFSAALWPFATLGWPEQTERLEAFYPGDVLVTARDIINLWVARMLMMGIEFMGDIPFPDVYITSIIQAADGRRMSKSLGTGINPLDLIERYGADGTRYGLLKMSSTQDVRFAEGMIDEGAKLANKLWNASRFVLLQADTAVPAAPAATQPEDAWMLSRLEGAHADVLSLIDGYEFAGAVKTLYSLIWNDFCDWYVEVAKARLHGDDEQARRDVSAVLLWVLERMLALAHPVMPFVTEEIWSFMPGNRGLLMASAMPEPHVQHRDPALEEAALKDMEVVSEARRIANDGETPAVVVRPDTLFRSLLPKSASVTVDASAAAASATALANAEQLESRLAEATAELERARAKLANEGFIARAPAELVEAEREKVLRFEAEIADLRRRLAEM
ncbi:MAG: valyl-tRNA synthetase [Gaiellales bacterium]|nr:valyl-tRNA synthetase [Gaiellales bacterium]